MKLLDIQQNTPDWDEIRSCHVGASDIGTLMDGSEREIYDLLQYKRGLKKKHVTSAMQHGTDTEAEAIEHLIGRKRDDAKEKITAIADAPDDWLMASFDFLNLDDGLLVEAKCPKVVLDMPQEHSHFSRWEWQVQAQLAVWGGEIGYIYVYSDVKQTKAIVYRDELKIRQLKEKGKWFWNILVNFEELPPPPEATTREDDVALDWALAYRSVDLKIKELEEEKKVLRDEGIALAIDQSFSCAGVKVIKVPSRETIDYEAACRDHNIDLSKYKKIPKVPYTWRISSS